MTLVQLRHLVALADSGSFSRAADKVHLTQPALSRSIQALEGELGAALVDRIGRRAELTPTGREVTARARELLFEAHELHERGRRVARGLHGTLRVGMGSGPGVMLMTPLLLEVAQQRPQWRVEVARGATALLVERLRARLLDAVVVDVRSLEPAADLAVSDVCEMRGAFLVRAQHPLARQRSVAFADLAAYPLASIPLSAEVARLLVERYGPAAHPDQAVNIRCDEIASLVEVAKHSDAVLLAVRASAPQLTELPMSPALGVAARLGLVTLARRTEAATLRVVRELMARRLVDPPARGRGDRGRGIGAVRRALSPPLRSPR
ncbi:MAG: LysR family transcriptional regulator [Rubrivivax sp.]|nr:LysR family transcriptional regulator [Rubrivivax sp.]